MDGQKLIEVVLRWVHVGAAAYWLAVGFYMWQTIRAELEIDGETFTKYSAQMARVTKLGKAMAISSGTTVLAGLLLYGVARYWTRGFETFGAIIFNLGVVAGIIGAAHGGMVFSRGERQIRGILLGVSGTPTGEQVASFRAASEALVSKLPLHFAIIAFAFLTMIAGAAIA